MRILKYLVVALLLILGQNASAQNRDSTRQARKVLFEDNRLFNGIRAGVDVAGFIYPFVANKESFKVVNKFEINGDFGIKKWFAALDLGNAKFQSFDKESLYGNSTNTSSGSYFRIGADYRISRSAKSFLSFGGRFGQAFFKETINYTIYPIEQNGVVVSLESIGSNQRNLAANWIELTPGLKVFIWKNLYLGYTIRMKFLIPSGKIKDNPPMHIPGYGVGNRNTDMGFSFHIMYRIPFGRDPEIPLKGR